MREEGNECYHGMGKKGEKEKEGRGRGVADGDKLLVGICVQFR